MTNQLHLIARKLVTKDDKPDTFNVHANW